MSEETAPGRIAVIWSPEAPADPRAIARDTAMQILSCIDPLSQRPCRRCEKAQAAADRLPPALRRQPVFFDLKGDNAVEITAVRNRREAYR